MLNQLIGNSQVKQQLGAALSAGRLPHGVVISGEDGLGRGFCARCLAADYLYPDGGPGARAVMEGRSPEVLVLEGEGASGEIRVERVREVRAHLFDTALSAEGRVVFIRDAARLNRSSGNILLKVLEEPPPGVLFVLTAPGVSSLLPTVLSRCAVYSLSPVSGQECCAFLSARFPGREQDAQLLSTAYGGRPGSGLRCLASERRMELFMAANRVAAACVAQQGYTVLKELSLAEKDRAEAACLLRDCADIFEAGLLGRRARGLTPVPDFVAAALIRVVGEYLPAVQTSSVSLKIALTAFGARLSAAASAAL